MMYVCARYSNGFGKLKRGTKENEKTLAAFTEVSVFFAGFMRYRVFL